MTREQADEVKRLVGKYVVAAIMGAMESQRFSQLYRSKRGGEPAEPQALVDKRNAVNAAGDELNAYLDSITEEGVCVVDISRAPILAAALSGTGPTLIRGDAK